MFKKEVTYDTFDGENIGTANVNLLFKYTLVSVKNYEQTYGGNFFEDLQRVLKTLTGLSNVDLDSAEEKDLLQLVPQVIDPEMQSFLFRAIPCLFIKYEDGKFIQNEQTVDEATASPWLIELTGVDFFFEIFNEISKTGGIKINAAGGQQKKD